MAEDKTENKDFFLKMLPYLPIITIISLGYGIVRQVKYYNYFSLNILQFYDTSEIVPRSLYDLIVIVVIIIFFSLGTYGYYKLSILYSLNSDSEVTLKTYKLLNSVTDILILFSFLTSSIVLIIKDDYYDITTRRPFILCFLIMGLLTSFFRILLFLQFKKIKFNSISIIGVFLIIWLIILSNFEGFYKYVLVKQEHIYENSYIVVDKVRINSSKNFYYIGQTKSSVFYYDEKRKAVNIYPMALVSEISLTAK